MKRAQNPVNHFLALRVRNPAILASIKTIGGKYSEAHKFNGKGVTPWRKSHVTLCVFHLADENVERAKILLDECAQTINQKWSKLEPLSIKGVGNFDKSVVFAGVEENESLSSIASITREAISSAVEHFDPKPFHPHVTIFKPQRKNKFQKPKMSFFKPIGEFDFGQESISTIELCSMTKPQQPDGFYHVEHIVSLNGCANIAENKSENDVGALLERAQKVSPKEPPTQPKRLKKVNYFLAIPILNRRILGSVKSVGEQYCEHHRNTGRGITAWEKSHITLGVFHLEDEQLGDAKEQLDQCVNRIKEIQHISPITVKGIGNFGNKVVFAQIEESESLSQIAAILRDAFSSKFAHFDTRPFNPHLTIFKPRRENNFKKPKMSFFDPIVEYEFGVEHFSSIQLCSMEKAEQENGYYHVDHQVNITMMEASCVSEQDFEEGRLNIAQFYQTYASEP